MKLHLYSVAIATGVALLATLTCVSILYWIAILELEARVTVIEDVHHWNEDRREGEQLRHQ